LRELNDTEELEFQHAMYGQPVETEITNKDILVQVSLLIRVRYEPES